MTPKEKAKQLFKKFYILDHKIWQDTAKQCALIAVDEILDLNLGLSNCDENNWDVERFYKEVKNEIEKL